MSETKAPHLYTTKFLFKKICQVIDGIIPPNAGKDYQVLDVPAGAGALTFYLNETKKVAVKAGEYDTSKWTYKKIPCEFIDLSNSIPYPDNTFDLVICLEGLKHIPNVQKALAEMKRVAKPGGKILLTIPNDLCLQARFRYFFDGFSDVDWKHPMVVGDANDKSHIYLGSQLSLPYLWFFLQKQGLRFLSTAHDRLRGNSLLLALIFYPLIVIQTYRASKKAPQLFRELISLTWLAGRHNLIIVEKV